MAIEAPSDVYTIDEAADRLNCHPRTVQRRLKSGALEGWNPDGPSTITALAIWRYLKIDEDMTDAWIKYCLMSEAARRKTEDEDGA